MEFLFCVLGMVLVIEGLPYFGFPEKMKALLAFVQQQEETTLRFMGGGLILVGLAILFVARGGLNY